MSSKFGFEGFRQFILRTVEKRFGGKRFYQEYRPTIETVISYVLFSASTIGITWGIWEAYKYVWVRHNMFNSGISLNTPASLGGRFYHNKHPGTPPIVYPQKKYYPYEYDMKSKFAKKLRNDLMCTFYKAEFIYTAQPKYEDDREVLESMALARVEKLSRDRISEVMKGFNGLEARDSIRAQYNKWRSLEADDHSGRREDFGVFPLRTRKL